MRLNAGCAHSHYPPRRLQPAVRLSPELSRLRCPLFLNRPIPCMCLLAPPWKRTSRINPPKLLRLCTSRRRTTGIIQADSAMRTTLIHQMMKRMKGKRRQLRHTVFNRLYMGRVYLRWQFSHAADSRLPRQEVQHRRLKGAGEISNAHHFRAKKASQPEEVQWHAKWEALVRRANKAASGAMVIFPRLVVKENWFPPYGIDDSPGGWEFSCFKSIS